MTISKILLCFDRAVARQDDIDIFKIRQDFENFQFTASFKERGALNRLLSLDAAQRASGVGLQI